MSHDGRPCRGQLIKEPYVLTVLLSLALLGQRPAALVQPWRDGTTDVVFDPVEFLARLAVLVPRPRINLILHHGVLGPRAAWRAAEDGRA